MVIKRLPHRSGNKIVTDKMTVEILRPKKGAYELENYINICTIKKAKVKRVVKLHRQRVHNLGISGIKPSHKKLMDSTEFAVERRDMTRRDVTTLIIPIH